MRLLLDTHSFLWFIAGDQRLSTTARELIINPENNVLVSVASLWEIAIKHSLERLELEQPFDELIPAQLALNDFRVLAISLPALGRLTSLPFHHRDPFDRLIIAQALTNGISIFGKDGQFSDYAVECFW